MLNGPIGSRHRSWPSAVKLIRPNSWKKAYTDSPSVTGLGDAGPVDVLDAARLAARHVASPQLFARRAVQGDYQQLVVRLVGRVRCEKDARLGEDRRGMPRRQRRLPHDVGRRPDVGRQIRGLGDARAIGPAKAAPIGGPQWPRGAGPAGANRCVVMGGVRQFRVTITIGVSLPYVDPTNSPTHQQPLRVSDVGDRRLVWRRRAEQAGRVDRDQRRSTKATNAWVPILSTGSVLTL